jgi:hypothetical protein
MMTTMLRNDFMNRECRGEGPDDSPEYDDKPAGKGAGPGEKEIVDTVSTIMNI